MSDRWSALRIDEQHRQTGDWDDCLLDQHLETAARSAPNRVAIVDRDDRVVYRELDELVRRLSSALTLLGVEPGTVVSWQLPNWWEAVVVHQAVIRIGAVSNPLMPILRERELKFMLTQASSRVLIVPETFRGFAFGKMADTLAADLPDIEHVVIVRPTIEDERSLATILSSADPTAFTPSPMRTADDPLLLLYTSGTEADPKGVVHSHNTLGYENRSIIELFRLSAEDVIFMPSPVAHITGVLYGLQLPMMLETAVVFQDIWEPGRALDLLARERCSFMVAATPFLHMLVHHPELADHDLGSLRTFACGGADVPPALVRSATEKLDACVVRAYGSSEFPTLCSSTASDPLTKRADTDGRVIGRAEARVVLGDGTLAETGQPGELQVRGPERFLGYLDSTLTESALEPGGWFRTGDLATIAAGYVTIKGRLKDIIIRGGENISAKEIEDLLVEYGAREVAIVAAPDPVMGERVCAFVVPAPGTTPTLDDLVAFLTEQKIARQKLPERLELVAELPKTPSGKIKKFELRQQVASLIAAETLARHD